MLTGGFGRYSIRHRIKVAEAIGLPAQAPFLCRRALPHSELICVLMTPFDRASNESIKTHVDNLGFTLHLGPSFDNRIPGTSLKLSPDQLFDLVTQSFRKNPAQAIYFQGATMDPLPIIQRIEDVLAVPVITSNTAMIWNLLSKLGLKYSVKAMALLKEWPACG